ncbi:hypothetical protein JNB_07659 [Janibacter sp. HTCC2649]|uniref:Sec-independent protein translocase subunit TatB n=1 Tax=Janibacter sp. HTCC2649 TaxID=313589 RepID=UPI0000670AAD|nr:Sec-independent protein translocase subunit TatB [Janibacter sp. HTCC2649]EAQ00029.1 hypothetical protein JNB_07659 [Janibacter sp. HTCC2649]
MFGINGWEIVLLALIAVFVLGPERLPEYAQKLAQMIKKARVMAEGAKGQLKDQLGPEYNDINWRQYDPRQYDPRRIVREALIEPLEDAASSLKSGGTNPDIGDGVVINDDGVHYGTDLRTWDPLRATPYDVDAT